MEPFAQRKAAADARRDSSDNMGDLVGCLSAWPATEAAPEVVDVARHAPRTAAARAADDAARALEAAERARAWGQGPPDDVVALRRQRTQRTRTAGLPSLGVWTASKRDTHDRFGEKLQYCNSTL